MLNYKTVLNCAHSSDFFEECFRICCCGHGCSMHGFGICFYCDCEKFSPFIYKLPLKHIAYRYKLEERALERGEVMITEQEILSFGEIADNYSNSEDIDQIFVVDKDFGLEETAAKLLDPEVISENLLASKIIKLAIPDSHIKFISDEYRPFTITFSKIDLNKNFEVITAAPVYLIKENSDISL